MPSFRTGTVTSVLSERRGLQRVLVDGEKAYVLTQLIGPVAEGDRVVINTTAVDLELGTGGWHFVHWNLERDTWSKAGPGHIMKLRYTSLQADTGAMEDAEPNVDVVGLADTPVVGLALHSQLPIVAAACRAVDRKLKVVYVMTDSNALPLALSDIVAELRDKGMLTRTITAGQAFGGDYEAVNLRSALDVAVTTADADVIIAGGGPGVTGTASELGFSGLDVADILRAASQMGGQPVIALRWSDADERERHRGLSHHSQTVLRFAPRDAAVPVPEGYEIDERRSESVSVPPFASVLTKAKIEVRSMGRTLEEDPGFAAFAAAAGAYAARAAMRRPR